MVKKLKFKSHVTIGRIKPLDKKNFCSININIENLNQKLILRLYRSILSKDHLIELGNIFLKIIILLT